MTLDQGVAPQMVSADAGYWKESDVELLEINDIEPFVAPKRVKHSQWREMKAPRGRIPKDLDRKERMLRKLSTQRGRAEYGKRKTSAEPCLDRSRMRWASGSFCCAVIAKRKANGR